MIILIITNIIIMINVIIKGGSMQAVFFLHSKWLLWIKFKKCLFVKSDRGLQNDPTLSSDIYIFHQSHLFKLSIYEESQSCFTSHEPWVLRK